MPETDPGALNWRLSAHPFTLLTFLSFRLGSLLMYLFGVLFIRNFILVFIITLLLLSLDFYYLKNIAGRRLVGLRWWNEVNISTGDSHWVFESRETQRVTETSGGAAGEQNATDKRFFWLAMYVVPVCWVGLAVLAVVRLQSLIWLVTIGESCSYKSGVPPLSVVHGWFCGLNVHADMVCHSDCTCPHNHEYDRLLEMRQVQSGQRLGWKRVQWKRNRKRSGGEYGRAFLQVSV
jgi:hypothetical protein